VKRHQPAIPGELRPGEDVLALVRSKSDEDRRRLRAAPPEQLASALEALRPRDRAEFLERSERGPELVPLLAETAFASAVVATGLEHASWLVAKATAEQRVAAIDLDCWLNHRPIPERFFEWIDALIEAGEEALVRAFDELDYEVWILLLKRMADFQLLSQDEAAELPTIDGFVGFDAQSSEDEERVRRILGTAFSASPSHYWDFVYGAMNESRSLCQNEAAARQRGRLSELGFPERDHAMGVYRPLPVEAVPAPDDAANPADESALVTAPPGPFGSTLLGRALAVLPPDRAAEVFADILLVANSLAVADELPLAEPASVTRSLEKAVRGIECGLVAIAEKRGQSAPGVLASVAPALLFRAGATLDDTLRPRKTAAELQREEDTDAWSVPTEVIDPEDQTLGEDGALE
jgi:hypothetical protein